MKKTNKKGFTIVELVIVIAVIAILAAVLIPTFSSVIKKAQTSADIQACRQMNEYLAVNEVLAGKTITDAIDALAEGGMSAKNYKPLITGRYYFWDKEANRVVYASYDEESKEYIVLFPEDYTKSGQWFSLSGEVKAEKVSYTSQEANTVNISSGEEFEGLITTLNSAINKTVASSAESTAKTIDGITITGMNIINGNFYGLTGNIEINLNRDIDLMGGSFNLNLCNATFTLNGNGHKITGISNVAGFAKSSGNSEGVLSEYGSAIIGYAKNSTITFKDVIIEDSYFGNDSVKGSAVFVGQATESSVSFNNTTVNGCTINGKKGVAVYVGHNLCGAFSTNKTTSITFEGTNNVSNVMLNSTTNEIATAIGRWTINKPTASGKTNRMTVSGLATIFVENITQKCNGQTIESALYVSATNNRSNSTEDYTEDYTNEASK